MANRSRIPLDVALETGLDCAANLSRLAAQLAALPMSAAERLALCYYLALEAQAAVQLVNGDLEEQLIARTRQVLRLPDLVAA